MGIDVVHHLYSFNVFCSEDLQLLQEPIDAWHHLERLLYQSTVGKEANAPGLSQTCQPLSIVSLSIVFSLTVTFPHSSTIVPCGYHVVDIYLTSSGCWLF